MDRGRLPRWLVWIGGVLAAWALLAALVALQLLPWTPRTTRGWVLLLVVGPPAQLALEWASSALFSARTGARVSDARFSVGRIAVALLVALIALAPLGWWVVRSAR